MTHRRAWFAGLAALLAVGCGGPGAYVREGFMEHAPKRVAVLPFVITYAYDLPEGETIPASHRDARDMFRKTFYHALSPFGFEDVKLADVNAQLTTRWGLVEAGGGGAGGNRPHRRSSAKPLGPTASSMGRSTGWCTSHRRCTPTPRSRRPCGWSTPRREGTSGGNASALR